MGTVSWRKPGVAKAGVSGPPVPDNALDEGERLGETAEPHASQQPFSDDAPSQHQKVRRTDNESTAPADEEDPT